MTDGSLSNSPPTSRSPEESGLHLTAPEWEELGDIALAFYGAMTLCRREGFDESTGAKELLEMIYTRYESVLAGVRERFFDGEAPSGPF